jgi:RNA polymerase sigma factor (sigma-70 family)
MRPIRPSRRFNPYDVMADEGDISPEEAAASRMAWMARAPLPPTAPADYARRMAFEEKSEAPVVPSRKEKMPLRRGEVSARDLAVTQAVREIEHAAEDLAIRERVGMEVGPTEKADLKADQQALAAELEQKGFTRVAVANVQNRVWRTILDLTTRYAHKMLGSRSGVDPDDVAQEAALRAFLKIDEFEGQSKLSTWVYPIVRNLVKDALSRSRVGGITGAGGLGLGIKGAPRGAIAGRGTVATGAGYDVDDDESGEAVYDVSAYGDPESRMLAMEEAADLQSPEEQDRIVQVAFNKLAPEHKQILTLRTERGSYQMPDGSVITMTGENDYSWIARVLDVEIGTVMSRLSRARKRLVELTHGQLRQPFTGMLAQQYLDLAVQRQRRPNPYIAGIYYETAMDLLDLLGAGLITQEQHDECLQAMGAL